MNPSKLRLAFIGGGTDSAVGTTHVIAAQLDGRFEIVAACFSRDRQVNLESAERRGISADKLYDTHLELLAAEKDNIDAVVVLTPTPDHFATISDALEHSVAVISEKALVTSSWEATELKKLVDNKRGFLTVTYNYTGYPMLRELRSLIQSGELGEVRQLQIEMPQEGFLKVDSDDCPVIPQDWRLKDGTVPTIYLDLFVHVHNIVYFLTQQHPKEVLAVHESHGHFPNIVDNVNCLARYTNRLDCNIWFSKSALGHRNGLRVRAFGSNGSAEWLQMDPEFLTVCNNQGRTQKLDRSEISIEVASQQRYNRFKPGHPAGFIEAFSNLYSDIADALQGHLNTGRTDPGPYIFDIEHAIEGLSMSEAMVESASNHAWSAVPDNTYD